MAVIGKTEKLVAAMNASVVLQSASAAARVIIPKMESGAFVAIGVRTARSMEVPKTLVIAAPMTLFRALKNRIPQHKKLARWTMPIWLYVSVTGVVVYYMLYQM